MMRNLLLICFLTVPMFGQYSGLLGTNTGFSAWGFDNPTGWNRSAGEDGTNYDTQNPTGVLQMIRDGSNNYYLAQNMSLVVGKTYRVYVNTTVNTGSGFIRTGISGANLTLATGVAERTCVGNGFFHIFVNAGTIDIQIDSIAVQQKLDTLYISAAGSDAALGDADNPIATIAEAIDRGFYGGGVFAFRSGDTFNETFTAGNNCELIVYGGSSAVTITTIADGGFTVTQSELINPVANKKSKYSGFNGWNKY